MAELRNDVRVWMYEHMLASATFEENLQALITSGQLRSFYLPQRGQEASSVALGALLQPNDVTVTNYRGMADHIAKGVPMPLLAMEIFGKEGGACGGRAGPMHMMDWKRRTFSTGIVAGGIPVAVGTALAQQLSGEGGVVACIFGDGATNNGAFHEALNCASLWKLPIVFVCQNNRYGESTPQDLHQVIVEVSERAKAYGMPGVSVDGNDPDACYTVLDEAMSRARTGGGPTLVEAKTFRLMGHFVGDPMIYMRPGELEEARGLDPIPMYGTRLLREGIFSADEQAEMVESAKQQVAEAIAIAKQAPEPSLDSLQEFVYAT